MEWLNNSVRNGAISHQQPASNHRNRKRISSRTFVSQTRYITETISLFGSGVAPPGGLGARAPPPVGRVCPPSGNLKILVGDGWVMIFTKQFNVRDRLRQSFFCEIDAARTSSAKSAFGNRCHCHSSTPTRTAIRSHLSRACRRPEVTKNVRSFGLKHAVVNPWTYQTESHEDHKEQEDYPQD